MSLVVIAHNIRSIHNIGSIFRTCDGFGAEHLYLTGYSPYPYAGPADNRLPHLARKQSLQIHKTALGAERSVPFSYRSDPLILIPQLKTEGYCVIALEQHAKSTPLQTAVRGNDKIALILGEEVHGIESRLLDAADRIAEIPMHGSKESFNVAVAAGIAMYAIRQK